MFIENLTNLGQASYSAGHREGRVYVEVALKRSRRRPTRFVAVVEDVCVFVGTGFTRHLNPDEQRVFETLKPALFDRLFEAAKAAGWREVPLPAPNEYGISVEFEAPPLLNN